ncbi:MAG: tyrosine-protein phosphatase [Sphingomonadales bacterium]|nr:tyrosine-protein phosphatase [Sphingomonadales bacterium]MBU3991959.1 tyrosine-protein phosphatase [Alphaproteobacteria bacterium]
MTEAWQRVLEYDEINNFRDYGGWRTQDGGRVKTGRLFRSAHHGRASAGDADRLRELGITVVADLRHPSEQQEQPSTWLGALPITVVDAPDSNPATRGKAPHVIAFEQSDFSHDAMRRFMVETYGEMAFDPRLVVAYSRYFRALDDLDGAILIHCAAGKDRTGVLAALTHRALGVHADDLMEDFLLTNTAANIAARLPGIQARMQQTYGREISVAALQALLRVEEEYLQRMWQSLDERFGSAEGYLESVLGVDAAMRDRLRAKLLA